MASILILNQYFPPDTAVTGRHAAAIAVHLAAAGHRVRVVTGQPSYSAGAEGAPTRERRAGVAVRRISTGRRVGRERMGTRVFGYLAYLAGALRVTWRSRPDLIIAFHNPPLVGALAAILARRTCAALIYIPEDIHPDIVIATGFVRLPGPVVRAWEGVNRFILGSATRVVVLGEGMRRTLEEGKGTPAERLRVIPPWAEPALEPRTRDAAWRQRHAIGDGLLAICAGNMGVMHPLEPVLDAAAALADRDITFAIAGTGVRRAYWESQVAGRGLANVRLLPFQHGEDFHAMVAAADVTLVPLAAGMERLAVPSRAFVFLSAGRPVIAVMAPDADVSVIVRRSGAGWQVQTGAELTALLERLLGDPDAMLEAGRRARAEYESHFTAATVLARYGDLAAELVGRP